MASQLQRLVPCPTGPLQVADLPPGEGSSPTLSLIIPTYNEGQNLGALLRALEAVLNPVLPNDYELILVDDDSPDLTWQQGLALGEQLPQLRVMRRQGERGLSSAVIRGWQVAQGQRSETAARPEIARLSRAAVRHATGGSVAERAGRPRPHRRVPQAATHRQGGIRKEVLI